ncbi:MAG: PH domain-containing protein [Pyrinomonadaceae bacterium]
MYCNKCGTENPDDAAFCKKCGSAFQTDEEETRIAERVKTEVDFPRNPDPTGGQNIKWSETDNAAKIFAINPTVKFVALGYLGAVVAAFAMVVLLTALVPGFVPLIGVVIGLLLLLVPVYFHIQAKLVRYSLTDTTIEIDRGLVSRTTQHIPLQRVQDVTVTASIFQRMLGYGDITIDNASEDGGKVVLDNIDMPKKYADMILRQMRSLDR